MQGQRHAEKLAALPASQLTCVVDIDEERARSVADGLGIEVAQDFKDLIGNVTAVVIATPTSTHFEIASTLMKSGIHVLLEKPLAATLDEAGALVDIAKENSVVFQVGHLERFNPVVVAIAQNLREPQFVESNRIAPFKPRSLDVSVVLDLMIHDIDLIHSFVRSPMADVEAVGRSVFSDNIDVANARIQFKNGCVANVTSSRISLKTERTLRIFEPDSYMSGDLHKLQLSTYSKRGAGPVLVPEDVSIDKQSFGASDALMEQARAFLDSVSGGSPPLVSGRTAMEALATATAIGDRVGRQQQA